MNKYVPLGIAPEDAARFPLMPFDAITLTTSPDYIVRGLIPREGLAVVWGPPKSGKSFFVFDLTMHVALGWPYRGRKVRPGPVVYVAAEGQNGFRKRVEAFRWRHLQEDHEAPPFYLLPMRVDLVADHVELVTSIRTHLGDTVPAVVVLDTLNRTFNGSESSDEDMGAYVAAADAIKAAMHCAVLIVHHCGVEGSRPRGHTSLTGAVDAQIAVKRDGQQNVVATVEWQKDGDGEGDEIVSKLETVELGDDDDGEPMTSCVIVPTVTAPDARHEARLPANQATMLGLIQDAGMEGIDTESLYAKARDLGIGVKRHATLHDATRALKRKGLVSECAGRWNAA